MRTKPRLKEGEDSFVLSARIPASLSREVEACMAKAKLSKAELVREAIFEYLTRELTKK